MANKIMESPMITANISRAVRAWLAGYPDRPIQRIDFENLGETSGLALSVVQGAYKTQQFIDGSYRAEYQFKIIYRVIADTIDDRLKADEELNGFAAWCESADLPELGEHIKAYKLDVNSLSALFARYENGAEDHQVMLTLRYEVNV